MTRATRRTVETVKTTEQLMEVRLILLFGSLHLIDFFFSSICQLIDITTTAWKEQQEYREALSTWTFLQNEKRKDRKKDCASLAKLQASSKPTPPALKLEMNGLSPHRYLFDGLSTLTAPTIHEVIIALPFNFAEKVKI